jgi:hypothetical protein
MGWPSLHERDQEKRDEAAFSEHKIADDLKKLLIASVEPPKFEKKSNPPPKLKKPKRVTAQERKYRALQRARVQANRHTPSPTNEAEVTCRWHLQELRLMLGRQAISIGPEAPYNLIESTGDDAFRSVEEMQSEIERLKIVLRHQHSMLKRKQRRG